MAWSQRRRRGDSGKNEHHHFLGLDRNKVQNKSRHLFLPEARQSLSLLPVCSVFLKVSQTVCTYIGERTDLEYMQLQKNYILNSLAAAW